MAEQSYPAASYNSGAVTEAEYEKIAARFSDDGIYNSPFDDTPVIAGAGLQVLIQPDFHASVRGFHWESGASEVAKTIDSNDGTGGPRKDWVVLRLDRSTWLVRVAVRKGTAGAGPPTLVRNLWDTGVYEIPLALVTVPVGANSLTDDDVVPYPLYVGSRIRFATGSRDPAAQPGALEFETDGYSSFDGTKWTKVIEDTGWVDLSMNGPAGGAWTPNTLCRARLKNGIVTVRLAVKRWASSGLATSDADGSVPLILPAAFRPTFVQFGHGYHDRAPVWMQVEADGSVRLIPLSVDLPAGRTVNAAATYVR